MMPHPEIYGIDNKPQEKVLRTKTAPFDFSAHTKKDIAALLRRMRRIMKEASGIGLSANQIGLNMSLFVGEVPDKDGGLKFYAIFNPTIEKTGGEKTVLEEGCLSVPGTFGLVERPSRITLAGYDKNQKPVKIKAWGLLAKMFQHEIDHLNGFLFIDRTKELYKVPDSERLELRENKGAGSTP